MRSANRRSGTWVSSNRACTRSNVSAGGGSVAMSCSRTSTSRGACARWVMSMSVATTVPVAPTWPASQVGTDAPPAPTSQQRHPRAMPSDVNVANVVRSKQVARAAKRSSASTRIVGEQIGRCRGHRAISSLGRSGTVAGPGAVDQVDEFVPIGSGECSTRIEGGQSFGDAGLGEDVTDSAQRLRHMRVGGGTGRGR